MTADLRDQLQATLSGTHTLERELGGGGMSKVFVAEEIRLGRKVVVKVLSPELAQGISVERFEREIKTVAALQQANIVPVISAGDTNGLPFYTMPFVTGESLRARLGRGPLSINEVVSVMRDVARALAFAHRQGVVHRDIKPDNVLLSEGAAVVTDFGIAKAISASRTGAANATLTQIGTSIGTPAYMAPEQAAGDPHIDHRADIYSLGAMAYELLSGQAVFANRTPQRMLAAHMSETPVLVAQLRPDTPQQLADLVMHCLAKEAKDRPQDATQILLGLETTGGGSMQAMPAVLLGGPGMLKKALAIYAGAFVAVAILAKAAIVGIGLPDWVFPGSLIVMALGLPVILWTGYVQRVARRAMAQTPTYTPGGTSAVQHGTIATMALKAAPHVSWYKTARGGMYAMGVFVVLIAAFMIMRQFGIGPFGSLLASGALKKDEPILLADFRSPASDTSLGGVVTEALRSELAKSKSVIIVPVARIREVLQRMQRPATTRVDFAVAREMATREGFKAIIDGEVLMLGTTRVLVARLVASQTGDELATFRETAKTDDEIIGAIDRLSRDLRERVGESLRSIHATESMLRVTTPSLAALKKFIQGDRAVSEGDPQRGHVLLEEAIALDTGFAMAYRRLGVSVGNEGGQSARVFKLLQQAYNHRDRLSDEERFVTEGTYFWAYGPRQDIAKAIEAYEAALEIAPDNFAALNNLGVIHLQAMDLAKAEPLLRRAMAVDSTRSVIHLALVHTAAASGRLEEADKLAAKAEAQFPRGATPLAVQRMEIAWAAGQLDSAARLAERLPALAGRSPTMRAAGAVAQATVMAARGKVGMGEQLMDAQAAALTESGSRSATLAAGLGRSFRDVWFRNDRAAAARRADVALATTPLASLDPADRPHVAAVRALAFAGKVDAAKAVLADFDRTRRDLTLLLDPYQRAQMSADIAMAEQRYDAAAAAYRDAPRPERPWERLPDLARAYDLGGKADSAIAVYARYAAGSEFGRLPSDALYLAPSVKRLGELYEAKGDRDNAIKQYTRFVELWKNADPELQPKVIEVKDRLRKLTPVERPKH